MYVLSSFSSRGIVDCWLIVSSLFIYLDIFHSCSQFNHQKGEDLPADIGYNSILQYPSKWYLNNIRWCCSQQLLRYPQTIYIILYNITLLYPTQCIIQLFFLRCEEDNAITEKCLNYCYDDYGQDGCYNHNINNSNDTTTGEEVLTGYHYYYKSSSEVLLSFHSIPFHSIHIILDNSKRSNNPSLAR